VGWGPLAADIERRTKARADLAEIDAAITAGLAESAAIITLTELSAFTGIAEADLAPATPDTPGRRGRQPRRNAAAGRKGRSVVAPAASAPVAVSSDY